MNRFSGIIDKFISWASTSDKLRAALIIGSQARADHQADESSDLDLIMIVDDPEYFLSSDAWLKQIGDYYVSFIEDTVGGIKERRVLFANALDVDFNILPASVMASPIWNKEIAAIFGRGYRVLIDKIGFEKALPPIAKENQTFTMPSEREFLNTVNDFWYHAVLTAKKLKRGELWTAKACMDCHMNWQLLVMIEWYARAKNGINYDTWHNGRFLEEWAEPWIVERLAYCFSHYNCEDIESSLLSVMKLFRQVAVEVAEQLGFEYPYKADDYAASLVVMT